VPNALLKGRSIGDVAAVLEQADLVLCNDTGVMHVSCAAGANTLAVFGPTDPVRWAPRSPNLFVIRAADGDLRGLQVESVVERTVEVMGLVNRAQSDPER
jgi:ADP-heptose:LPS heptosyltransferase